jgi:hypothetical protein
MPRSALPILFRVLESRDYSRSRRGVAVAVALDFVINVRTNDYTTNREMRLEKCQLEGRFGTA